MVSVSEFLLNLKGFNFIQKNILICDIFAQLKKLGYTIDLIGIL